MNNYQKTAELVEEYVREHGDATVMNRREFMDFIHETYENISYEKNNVSPSDICYNQYNNGLVDFPGLLLCLECIGKSEFRLLGKNYPYTGEVYQYMNTKSETVVGSWVEGKYNWI